jgi:hypothetical protein
MTCVDGAMVDTCVPGTPSPEVCDGLDNDCDNAVDEDIAPVPSDPCGVGACEAPGQDVCEGGQWVYECTPGTPGEETCPYNGIDDDCDGLVDNNECGCTTAPVVTASDRGDGMTYVDVTWTPCEMADSYKVYKALYEEDATYELIAETTEASYQDMSDWQTDVIDVIGEVPRMDPCADDAARAAFGVVLDAYRLDAIPVLMGYKAPSYYKVEACADGVCSPMSDPEPGQADYIHTLEFSEIAEVTMASWGYPALMALTVLPQGPNALYWCGLDRCGPGDGMVMVRLNQLNLQTDIWYENWTELWPEHPSAYFHANGYMGGIQSMFNAMESVLEFTGEFTMDVNGEIIDDAFVWFWFAGTSGYPTSGKMTFTYNGLTGTYDLPILPFDWEPCKVPPSPYITAPVEKTEMLPGTPDEATHMPFSEMCEAGTLPVCQQDAANERCNFTVAPALP